MMSRGPICCVTAIVLALAGPEAVAAGSRSALQASCWPPSMLAGRVGENLSIRRNWRQAVRVPDVANLPPSYPAAIRGAIRRVALPAGKKLIALTFDLCETAGEMAGYDGAVIDYLRSQRIKATYFAG